MDRLDAMRLYVRLVELKSFSAAAREQRVKQSTASKWLALLEEEFGVTLIARTTRALRVTEQLAREMMAARNLTDRR